MSESSLCKEVYLNPNLNLLCLTRLRRERKWTVWVSSILLWKAWSTTLSAITTLTSLPNWISIPRMGSFSSTFSCSGAPPPFFWWWNQVYPPWWSSYAQHCQCFASLQLTEHLALGKIVLLLKSVISPTFNQNSASSRYESFSRRATTKMEANLTMMGPKVATTKVCATRRCT